MFRKIAFLLLLFGAVEASAQTYDSSGQLLVKPPFAIADDAAFTLTTDFAAVMGTVRDDALSTLSAAEGDVVPLRVGSTGALWTTDTNSSTMNSFLSTLAGAVSGTEFQVDIVSGSSSGTEYTEDDAGAANPSGPTLTFIRNDAAGAIASADGDVVALRGTNYGAIFTSLRAAHNGTPAYIEAVNPAGGGGETALYTWNQANQTDDGAFTVASDAILGIGALADEAATDSVNEGDVGIPRMTLDRKLLTRLVGSTDANRAEVDGSGNLQVDIAASSATVSVDDASGSLTVDGTVTADAGTGPWPVTDNSGSLTVDAPVGTPLNAQISDGTDTALVSGSGSLQVTCDNCGGSTFADDDAFTGGSSAVSPIAALYDTTPPTVTDGSAGIPRMSSSRILYVDGSNATQPVSGTVTADAGTGPWPVTDNSGSLTVDDGGSNLSVDWGGTAPPIGAGTEAAALRVTVATDSTGLLSVDDGSGSLTVDGTVTADAGTGPWPVTDNSGSLTVDNGGTFAVQADSVVPGTSATSLGKAEDAAVGSGDTGVSVLLERDDSPTSSASADGDYITPKANTWGHQFVTTMCQDPNLATSIAIAQSALNGNAELVSLTASQTIYICGYDFTIDTATTVRLVYGTGTACATGETGLTGLYEFAANGGLVKPNIGGVMKTAASNALCIETGGSADVAGSLQYVKF